MTFSPGLYLRRRSKIGGVLDSAVLYAHACDTYLSVHLPAISGEVVEASTVVASIHI